MKWKSWRLCRREMEPWRPWRLEMEVLDALET